MRLKTLPPRLKFVQHSRVQVLQAADATPRLRGRAAVARRARWLAAHPLCVHCESQGLVTVAVVPDHIVPLWAGGADDENNLQSLCREHHNIKTAAEAGQRSRGWLG